MDCKEFNDTIEEYNVNNKQPLPIITGLQNEVRIIAEKLQKANNSLYQSARKTKEAKGSKNMNSVL